MTQLTLSPGQVQQLQANVSLVECRDPSGNLVGFLHLAGSNAGYQVKEFSAEELEAYKREPGGRSLGEILTDLRKRR